MQSFAPLQQVVYTQSPLGYESLNSQPLQNHKKVLRQKYEALHRQHLLYLLTAANNDYRFHGQQLHPATRIPNQIQRSQITPIFINEQTFTNSSVCNSLINKKSINQKYCLSNIFKDNEVYYYLPKASILMTITFTKRYFSKS
jgi:hypothetical protein